MFMFKTSQEIVMMQSNWKNTKLYGIESERIKFTQMRVENTNAIHVMASDPEVSQYIGWPLTKTSEETLDYVNEMLRREEAGTFKYANIVDKQFGRVIGNVMLFGHDQGARHAEIGYVIDKSLWGKGLGTEVIQLVMDHAFGPMGLRKLHARVVSENIGSAKILEKNNFAVEGLQKDYFCINNKLMDCIWYGYINE